MAPPSGKVAFITGVNGITGNALVEHLIRQPAAEWSKIIISSRRRVTQVFWQDARIEFIPLDLLRPVDELIEAMKPVCHDVTHAFFASYVHESDFSKLRNYNVSLFTNFLTAIDTVAANKLQRVCLHTGGKHYGAHLGPTEVPLHEDMPRYKDYGENFYYTQEDFMFDLAAKRGWAWNVIRPDAIIGFTPAGNGMSMALTLGMYMLCCREMGQVPIFPGNKLFYSTADDCSYAPSIADMAVWAMTNENARNEAFNHVNGDVFLWKYFWPKLGNYFGIDPWPKIPEQLEWNALGEDEQMANNFHMVEWAKDKKHVWEKVVAKHGGSAEAFDWGTWDFVDWALGKAWSTLSSVSKARKFGWTRSDDTYTTYVETFRAFENAGILPASNFGVRTKTSEKPRYLAPNPGEAALMRRGLQKVIKKTKAETSPKQNGITQNGTAQNGTAQNGTAQNGIKKSDPNTTFVVE
ncbi:hypothetical protein AK830_g8611 [Neonectria ditissima]|uniref:PRISE-like Rossmann-fold domain-containing protein n=1 Tax=Neonectria ditissima TaxID=78410 RepID=A0A0P7AX14_9HYPO|nr:hypothetical protein AK830_g8611 [Neonectria ditissima]